MPDELTSLDELVRTEIHQGGPLPFAAVMDRALYDPDHGFYAVSGHAGRRGDFLTSPEVGPLFGRVIANAIDAEWDRLGRPEVFTVVDFGAGPGTLARTVLAAHPACSPALRYVAVERSAEQRAMHPEAVLSLDELAPEVVGDGISGMVIANELLDNMAFTPVRRIDGELRHLDVGEVGGVLELVPGDPVDVDHAACFDAEADSGVLQLDAARWLIEVMAALNAGRVLVFDYARPRSGQVEIRTYAAHGPAGDPLAALGTKDITVDVDLGQLERAVRPADAVATQGEWLAAHGIEELVDEGRRMWESGAAVGSLEALMGRSRVREAEALTEPGGLGGFTVAEWVI